MTHKRKFFSPVFIFAGMVGAGVYFISTPAHAYIIPALGLLSYLGAPVVAVLGLLGMLLMWPVRALLRKIKNRKKNIE